MTVDTSKTESKLNNKKNNWSTNSWQSCKISQMPVYTDIKKLEETGKWLSKQAPLVFAGEIRKLHTKLADVSKGKAFVLQGGDCAESFDEFSANMIRDTLKVFLQMSVVLTFGAALPVVKIGRIAGQFAKPRSSDMETIDGVSLPSYRGDIINSNVFNEKSRYPDPSRMKDAYHQSASTLNLIRALTKGGFASLEQVHSWNLEFIKNAPCGRDFEEIASRIDDAIAFMNACGISDGYVHNLSNVDFFTSHEALLLPYEEALTRQDSLTNKWYDCSAHLLWIGDRTRKLNEGHVEFLRGVENPIGIKVGSNVDLDELNKIIEILNPYNIPGRISLIVRFGFDKIAKHFPSVLRSINKSGHKVAWICDPMHGNTIKSESGYKTRPFNNILEEVRSFFEICDVENSFPGGVHFEMTGKNVTECTGGLRKLGSEDLSSRYHTACDPRLNAEQALELSFLIYQSLKIIKNKGLESGIIKNNLVSSSF